MSWENESQLVRGATEGQFNLAIGDPVFLREVFQPYYPRHYPADLSYPDTKPSPELLAELQKLHPGQEIVVTCGAKQALHAAAYALKEDDSVVWLTHRTPCWPSYPTLADMHGMHFSDIPMMTEVNCNTSPNNPDGTESSYPCNIWDSAYSHSVYGWSGMPPPHDISVWSAGKMLGSPGVRVGWLCTEDSELAERARRYVEQTTSGVPTTSQYHVSATLRNTNAVREDLYSKAREVLEINSQSFMRLHPYLDTVSGYPMNGRGMFAWFKVKESEKFKVAAKKAKVLVINGSACLESSPGWFRLSLGNTSCYTAAAIDALIATLEEQ
jgi:aspartate/methionine/tyrosine aminotransferase